MASEPNAEYVKRRENVVEAYYRIVPAGADPYVRINDAWRELDDYVAKLEAERDELIEERDAFREISLELGTSASAAQLPDRDVIEGHVSVDMEVARRDSQAIAMTLNELHERMQRRLRGDNGE